MTTQAIMEQAPYWLAKYGWYHSLQNIVFGIIMTLVIATIICVPIYVIPRVDSYFSKDDIKMSNLLIKATLFCVVMVVLFIVLGYLIPCFIVPELVGAKALIALIK